MLGKTCLQFGRHDIAGDEDDARAPIGVRPGVQLYRRVKNVMYAVNSDRRIFADQIEDAFHPQQVRACVPAQPRQPGRKRVPGQRLVADQAAALNAAAMRMFGVFVRMPVVPMGFL
jgi:hypothetical protein